MKLLVLFITLGIFAKGTSGNNQDTGLIIVDKEGDNNSSEIVTKPNVIKLDTSFEDEEDYNSEPFIPTKEWQVVKKGQSIPAGLHVRMNFQTHVREAKLMDGDDGARFYKDSKNTQEANEVKNEEKTAGPKIVLGDDLKKEENFGDPERLYFTKTHLKEALKDFRDKFHNEDLKTVEQEITRAEAVKKKFRSIEEIRKELGDSFGMQIKFDAQIMKLKIEVLKASNATEIERSNALEDLENYVHQIDNAVDLDKINGFEAVIQYLNHSVTKLQEKAAKVIGSAVQSNPKAQAAALKHDAIPHLLRLVSYSGDERLRKTSVFALSALVRTNPSGQVAFLKLDGLTHLLSLIDNHASPALRIKAITLISDLILEQEDVKQQMVKNGKMQQHQKTPFMKALIAKGWCELLPTQLGLTDHDSLEKLLSAIMASKSGCKNSFIKSGLKGKLNQIKQKYFDEINKEDDVDFKSYLKTFPDQITNITMDL